MGKGLTRLTRVAKAGVALAALLLSFSGAAGQKAAGDGRVVSGVVVTRRGETVPGAVVALTTAAGAPVSRATTNDDGAFRLLAPREALTLRVEGENIPAVTREVAAGARDEGFRVVVEFVVPPIHESVVIVDSSLQPGIERRNEAIYRGGLFSRDDQIFDTLAAGINAGQHEGGGKSLEVRRFGFNLDHGGLSGGLKVLVDDVQQNFGTQGHGQGYLGQLKSLTPELVAEVNIINGPFSAQYGDFSGLGVVHIRTAESLPEVLTARLQGGSFDARRAFLAYSPALDDALGLLAYEASRTDGPFVSPLRYRRDNLTGSYTRNLGARSAAGFKLNAGRNDFFSSGQIPLDEVAAGRLGRFGFLDADNGGRVRSGTVGLYYRRESDEGAVFKIDGYLTRSLFDLWSNFTFFLADPEFGDEIQQHDSRLQQGANVQYVRPHTLLGARALLVAGGNFQAFQTRVGLYPSVGRDPGRAYLPRASPDDCPADELPGTPGFSDRLSTPCFLLTDARARVANAGLYVQQAVDLFDGRLHVEGGLRYDRFRFDVEDLVRPAFSGARGEGRFQPKAAVAFTPSREVPVTLHFNYGRGISSQDARGVARRPDSPRVATTDFYQTGASFNAARFSVSADLFLVDNSNQQVYVPDDGTIEFAGASRAYGYEAKTSVRLSRHLSFNGGLTRVMNAFFRGTSPREYVDSAPHRVANAGLTLSDLRGFSGSLRYRHASSYRLDPLDAGVRAAGLDVIDFGVNKRLRRSVELNLAVDNLFNKRYFETQNYFESRLRPDDEPAERIHATPGFPFGVTVGVTFRFGGK
jgi:outer membrane receptor protein involved in Fe transport